MSSPRLFKQIFSAQVSPLGAGGNQYTTITAASNNVPLPTGTINVVSTTGFPSSGTIGVQTLINSLGQYAYITISYTGTTATSFTGCTGGTAANSIFTGYQIGAIGSIPVGTWTCPAGIKYIIITGCGGGGGGGGGASSSGRGQTNFAGGGCGGWASPTITQVIPVIPGVIYPISVGEGGIGGTNNCVANQVSVSGGGSRTGNPGSDGSSSIFGSFVFPGGKGGREGQLLAANALTFATGSDCSNVALSNTTNPSPLTIQSTSLPGGFYSSGYSQGPAHSVLRSTNQYSISGGGSPGGVSNNSNSTAGNGGQGAQGFDGYPFAGYGSSGTFGGGGGGGGGGENWDFNNTHEGGLGGWGGAGFIEVSWMA